MKTKIFFSIIFLSISACAISQIYLAKTCEISFFSKGPIEDISAVNTSAKPILNTASGEIAVKVTIRGFVFKKKLMEEHFNEKYLESDKYPYSTFTGKINEAIDYTKDSVIKVTVTGKLNIHGVEKEYTVPGTITIKGKEIIIESKFNVALKDHNITIPKIVTQNIAEIVEVKVNATLSEFKK
jgi:hypothetical protein